MSVRVEHGDCREVIKTLADCSVDSCVTDPPYSLVSIQKRFGKPGSAPAKEGRDGLYRRASAGFMGATWDTGETAFSPEFWAEVLRVLKPGGYLLAFGGDRTQHRLACAIEDAGFEIRGVILYLYGSGFPKSHNISKKLDEKKERCSCAAHLRSVRDDLDPEDALSGGTQQDVRPRLRGEEHQPEKERHSVAAQSASDDLLCAMRDGKDHPAGMGQEEAGELLLQPALPGKSERAPSDPICGEREGEAPARKGLGWRDEPGMEGGRHLPEAARELCQRSLREVPAGASEHGTFGRLCDGTSACDGEVDRPTASEGRGGASRRPQPAQQSPDESGTVAGQPEPQDGGAWPHCGRCSKPIVPDGLGTALKPAAEFIIFARKRLSENTVAANVLQHGTGALNIDGCRVEGVPPSVPQPIYGVKGDGVTNFGAGEGRNGQMSSAAGRWPANVIHDSSDEVLAAFPDAGGQQRAVTGNERAHRTVNAYGEFGRSDAGMEPRGDSGTAARFFYSAKADATDRLGSKHPTVKPVDLMAYLCRLVTPPGGIVLDPFAGSGTTGMACMREGFDCILIEREAAYVADIRRRLQHVEGTDTPLFGGDAA